MHSWIFYHQYTRPWMFYIYILCLSEQPFLGLVNEAASPPICLQPPSGASFVWPLGCFVLQILFQHLGISAKPWGLRSVLEGYPFGFKCPMFSGGVSKVSNRFSFTFYSVWSAEVLSLAWSVDHPGGICSYFCVSLFLHSCMEGLFRIFLNPKGPLFFGGYEVLRGTAPRLRAISWEVFSLPYFLLLVDKEVLFISLPLYLIGLIW